MPTEHDLSAVRGFTRIPRERSAAVTFVALLLGVWLLAACGSATGEPESSAASGDVHRRARLRQHRGPAKLRTGRFGRLHRRSDDARGWRQTRGHGRPVSCRRQPGPQHLLAVGRGAVGRNGARGGHDQRRIVELRESRCTAAGSDRRCVLRHHRRRLPATERDRPHRCMGAGRRRPFRGPLAGHRPPDREGPRQGRRSRGVYRRDHRWHRQGEGRSSRVRGPTGCRVQLVLCRRSRPT